MIVIQHHRRDEREERLGRLASAGVDVDKAESTGQLELKAWEEAHIVGGHFDQRRMLASLDAAASTGSSPYRLTRLWSNQEWALRDIPGVKDLIEYESCFNTIWPKHGDIVVCVYVGPVRSMVVRSILILTFPIIFDGSCDPTFGQSIAGWVRSPKSGTRSTCA